MSLGLTEIHGDRQMTLLTVLVLVLLPSNGCYFGIGPCGAQEVMMDRAHAWQTRDTQRLQRSAAIRHQQRRADGISKFRTCTFTGGVLSRWSDPKTWGGKAVPAPNSKVLIPCGKAVLFDIPGTGMRPLILDEIRVLGHLKFSDDPKTGNISIRVNNVLVEGLITAGSEKQHFTRRLHILLRKTAGEIQTSNGSKVGRKGFVIFGGQASLHGMPGGGKTPAWVSLVKNAAAGARSIAVNGDVSRWPRGGVVVIAPSNANFDINRPESLFWDTNIVAGAAGNSVRLSKPLRYKHWGEKLLVPGKPGVTYSESAEVALLTRNIVIKGEEEGLLGGHFGIMNTRLQNWVEGVEFVNLGQQGILGRYPGHWHFARGKGSYFRKNSIHGSKQRCVVVHATSNLLVEENVAYDNRGHCFMTEEGLEVNTMFYRNLAMRGAPVETVIPQPDFKNTDDDPSGFWMPATRQRWVGNHAVGYPSGFWIEAAMKVHGTSAGMKAAEKLQPGRFVLLQFDMNLAHANRDGFKTYPQGYTPYGDSYIRNLTTYKNSVHGALVRESVPPGRIFFVNCVFADNKFGLDIAPFAIVDGKRNEVGVWDSIFVGDSRTPGLPNLWEDSANAVPVGLRFDITHHVDANIVKNNHFAKFWGGKPNPSSPDDSVPHGIQFKRGKAPSRSQAGWWQGPDYFIHISVGNFLQRTTYDDATRVLYIPQSPRSNFAYLDSDGSFVGRKGVVLGMVAGLTPPEKYKCRLNLLWRAYLCPDVCYRSIIFDVPTATDISFSGYNKPVLVLTRESDAVQQPAFFDNYAPNIPKGRHGFNLFSSETRMSANAAAYIVRPASGTALFVDTPVNVRYEDLGVAGVDWPTFIDKPSFKPWGPDPTCLSARIRLKFPSLPGYHWEVVPTVQTIAACISGSFGRHSAVNHVFRHICSSSGENYLEVLLGHSQLEVKLVPGETCPHQRLRRC